MIQTIEDIQRLVKTGFTNWKEHGAVSVNDVGFGYQFNYTPLAVYRNEWTPLETMSRGLIIGYDGAIIARPFDKFFNWGEHGRTTESPVSYVMEKVDGSMGSVFLNPQTKKPQVATRGSVDNEQSRWATERLRLHHVKPLLVQGFTLIVEIVYPENRIVVDYDGREYLALLAIRHNKTGRFLPLRKLEICSLACGIPLAETYEAKEPAQLVELLPALSVNEEGFVAVFESGERFKFKGDAYKQAHRVLSGISYKRTIEYMENDDLDTLFDIVPDEWLDTVKAWISSIEGHVGIVSEAVSRYLDVDREAKELVRALQDDNASKLLFTCTMNAYRNKPFKPLILKHLKRDASAKSLIFGGEV